MTQATDNIFKDHKIILGMLRSLNQSIDLLEKGKNISFEIFDKAIDFIHSFIDKFHHSKEEEILFNLIKERGISSENGLISTLLKEHRLEHNYITKFEEAVIRFVHGDETARNDIIENGRKFSILLSHHIHKENTILSQLVNQELSEDDQQYLLSEFEKMKEEFGSSIYEKYQDMFEELEKEHFISYDSTHQDKKAYAVRL